MAEFEQHLTIEQLSTFLDGELSIDEQETVEHHLALCELCQQRLAELRQTVQLLHALPAPALPRSFVLPLNTVLAAPLPATAIAQNRTTRTQRPAPFPAYLRPLRALSGLAAILGIVFLLSAVFPMLSLPMSQSASSTSSGSAAMPAAASQNGFDREQLTQAAMNPHTVTKAPIATLIPSTPSPAYQAAEHDVRPIDTSPPAIVSLFDLSSFQGRAILGFLLLLLGVFGLTFFRRPRHV